MENTITIEEVDKALALIEEENHWKAAHPSLEKQELDKLRKAEAEEMAAFMNKKVPEGFVAIVNPENFSVTVVRIT